jgi:hypothetical protein
MGEVELLFVRKMFLPKKSEPGSIGSLKITVTEASERTWPKALGEGMNSRPSTPGGPGTGSSQARPVVKVILLSPEATVMGLPSTFMTKLFAGSLSPTTLRGISTSSWAPAGNPAELEPPVSVTVGSNSTMFPEIRNEPIGRVWKVPPVRIRIDWSWTELGRTVVLKIRRTARFRATELSPSPGSTRMSASSTGSKLAGVSLSPAPHPARNARPTMPMAARRDVKKALGRIMTTPLDR